MTSIPTCLKTQNKERSWVRQRLNPTPDAAAEKRSANQQASFTQNHTKNKMTFCRLFMRHAVQIPIN